MKYRNLQINIILSDIEKQKNSERPCNRFSNTSELKSNNYK